jgi:acyl-CoA hydrolase
MMISFKTHRLVKSEDLNHHGTLFAGRSAEWFVESGYIAATNYVSPENLICVKIHGMCFSKPVKLGEIICYESKIVYAGNTSLIAYVKVFLRNDVEKIMVDGFISFVHVNSETKPMAHGVKIEASTEEEIKLMKSAIQLKK